MSEAARILGEARNYQEFVALLRTWCDELDVSRETIDLVAGLPARYAAKLLAPVPIKALGKDSMGPVLGALGLKLVLAVDVETLEKIRPRLTKREAKPRYASNGMPTKKRRKASYFFANKAVAKIAAQRRLALLDAPARSRLARNAARARWRNHQGRGKSGGIASPIIQFLPASPLGGSSTE